MALPARLILLLLALASPISSITDGFRADLTVVKANNNNNNNNNHLRKFGRKLASTERDAASTLRLPADFSSSMYHLEFSIGTPPVAVKGVVDTGSSLSWTMCDPRASPVYQPSLSGTYNKLPCNSPRCKPGKYAEKCTEFCTYSYTYNDENYIRGTILTETLTLGDVSVPDVVIGCSTNTTLLGEPGIVGFGMTDLSLIGQLGLKKFSLCLAPFESSEKSPVFFGSAADIGHGALGPIQSVPFINHPNKPRDYWVSLKAVSIGKTRVETPYEATEKPDGNGLIVLDSGSDMSTFVMSTFESLKKAFVSEVNLPAQPNADIGIGEGICFKIKDKDAMKNLPNVVYHLDGVDLEFPLERFYVYDDVKGLACVKMRGMERNLSIWGNYQMMNMHMLYDWESQKLSFVPAQCEKL